MTCTRCENSGFLNLHQVHSPILIEFVNTNDVQIILDWIANNKDHDVTVCDCCGNKEQWYSTPGEHDNKQFGKSGPYSYNGGLPECY